MDEWEGAICRLLVSSDTVETTCGIQQFAHFYFKKKKNSFSHSAAAATVWIMNSNKPYGVAERNHTYFHMDKYYYSKT